MIAVGGGGAAAAHAQWVTILLYDDSLLIFVSISYKSMCNTYSIDGSQSHIWPKKSFFFLFVFVFF